MSERCRISADFGLSREDFTAQLGHTQGLRLLVSWADLGLSVPSGCVAGAGAAKH